MSKIILNITISILLLFLVACNSLNNTVVNSPDKTIRVEFISDEDGNIFYQVNKNNDVVLNKSRLGLQLKQGNLSSKFTIVDIKHSSTNEVWHPLWGEESEISSHYNEITICLQQESGVKMNVVFRLFNDGFGFRYEFPKQDGLQKFIITDELTEFAIEGDSKAWSIPVKTRFYEALFTASPISKLDWVSTPVTIEDNRGLYYAIHEANLTDYAAMNLIPKDGTSTLKAKLTPWQNGDCVYVDEVRHSPWRTMIIAQSAGDLILSRLMLSLNEPCKIEDTSWIKTGRYIGVWWAYHRGLNTWHEGEKHGATTQNVLKHFNFAAKHNFQGVLVEGWNHDWKTWNFDFTKPYDAFDIQTISKEAKRLGVDLIGHHETGGNAKNYEKQMLDAFRFYNEYNVSAVKTGYVGDLLDGKEMHSSQYGVQHYRHVIETAAKYKIMINNHEPIIPTGLQRTYPNLMTQEGVRGQEWDAWDANGGNPPSHTTILPFTRGLAGPMDFTPVTFDFANPINPQTRVQTTLAKQLALFVVLYSPWQMASDIIDNYEKNPKPFEFITSCPTDWAKTIVTEAKIGEYITIARKDKNSKNWFIGGITNENKRTSTLNLSFLDDNAQYIATIYKDGTDADYLQNPYSITIETKEVNKNTILEISQASSGGYAISLVKVE